MLKMASLIFFKPLLYRSLFIWILIRLIALVLVGDVAYGAIWASVVAFVVSSYEIKRRGEKIFYANLGYGIEVLLIAIASVCLVSETVLQSELFAWLRNFPSIRA